MSFSTGQGRSMNYNHPHPVIVAAWFVQELMSSGRELSKVFQPQKNIAPCFNLAQYKYKYKHKYK